MLLLVHPYSYAQRQVPRERLERRSRKALDLTRAASAFVIAELRCEDRSTTAEAYISLLDGVSHNNPCLFYTEEAEPRTNLLREYRLICR
jgi:hypothetical protein